MYLLRATDDQIGKLVYLSGFLAGAGVDTTALAEILDTAIEISPGEVEPEGEDLIVPDNLFELVTDALEEGEPELDPDEPLAGFEGEPTGGDLPPIDPTADPTSPESLGINLELPYEGPPPAPPATPHQDFGAGPITGDLK